MRPFLSVFRTDCSECSEDCLFLKRKSPPENHTSQDFPVFSRLSPEAPESFASPGGLGVTIDSCYPCHLGRCCPPSFSEAQQARAGSGSPCTPEPWHLESHITSGCSGAGGLSRESDGRRVGGRARGLGDARPHHHDTWKREMSLFSGRETEACPERVRPGEAGWPPGREGKVSSVPG